MPNDLRYVPPGFDAGLATELAELIVAAYDQFRPPPGAQSTWPLTPPHEVITTFSARLAFRDSEAFGFVSRNLHTGDLYVVFRGTDSTEDWLINVEVRQVTLRDSWGLVEAGFGAVYNQCATTIRDALRQALPRRVIVTGHSMGGALATLCAADIIATSGVVPALYTFASPRVGDPAFAARFNAECPEAWRIVNTEDLITNVPPSTSVLEGSHRALLDDLLYVFDRVPFLSGWMRRRLGWSRMWRSNATYEHVGCPVSFTKNNGTVIENHQMSTYLAAIRS